MIAKFTFIHILSLTDDISTTRKPLLFNLNDNAPAHLPSPHRLRADRPYQQWPK